MNPAVFRDGLCQRINDCHHKTKLPKFAPDEQWALGSVDTCKFLGDTRSTVRLCLNALSMVYTGYCEIFYITLL